MDTHALLRLLLQRALAPSFIGTVLWLLTDYFEWALGGVALSCVLTLGYVIYPLTQPFLAVLYEAWLAYRASLQTQRRTQLLAVLLPFLNAYRQALTAYPPTLLSDSAPAVTAQLEFFGELLRQVKGRKVPSSFSEAERPRGGVSVPPDEDSLHPCDATLYAVVREHVFTPRDFRLWTWRACDTWAQHVLKALTDSPPGPLKRAVRAFTQQLAHQYAGRDWEGHLAEAISHFDREVGSTLAHWRCLQQARDNPEVRRRLAVLLRLDTLHRQAGLQTYLAAKPLQCSPHEMATVMAHLRYDAVAARALSLVEAAAPGG